MIIVIAEWGPLRARLRNLPSRHRYYEAQFTDAFAICPLSIVATKLNLPMKPDVFVFEGSVYVCVYIHIYIYIYMYGVCVYIYIYIYICTNVSSAPGS